MALKKDLINSKGQNCDYHKIIGVSQIYIGEQKGININLASYTNKEYRLQNEEEMVVSNTPIFLPFTDNEDFTRDTLYLRIKAEIQEFIDAEDC